MRARGLLLIVMLTAWGLGCKGDAGADGTSCTATDNGDGTSTITCTDGTTVTVSNGTDGTDGTSCSITDNDDGTKTITCEDGTSVTVTDGANGGSCTIVDNGDGSKTISCDDGTTVTVSDGTDGSAGGNVAVGDLHGADYLMTSGEYAAGKYRVDIDVTGATAALDGTVSVDFAVANQAGTPIRDIASITANIAKLAPAAAGQSSARWVPYIYRTETVSGDSFPKPSGTVAYQGYREGNGTLTNHGDGSYTYVFHTNLATASVNGQPIAYERNLLHRVSLMLGGHTGPTDDAVYDFVPDGSTPTVTRDVVPTEACVGCHGEEFHGHGGDRMSVENCVTCHNPGSTDAQSGNTLDFEVMIHKIHAGGELPTVAGPDGNPWATADNGEYAIYGYGNHKISWEKVGFPAKIENCTKCHEGAADAENWQQKPGMAACTSCHDDVDLPTGTNHPVAQSDDANCHLCHGANGTSVKPIDVAHDWTVQEPRDIPEFDLNVTLTPPANGAYYTGTEAPTITIVVEKDGVALADHRLLRGAAQGCTPTATTPSTCPADTDGKWANTGLYVQGPRHDRNPVLTTRARAQILSTAAGPFTFAAATSLVVKLDQGVDFFKDDLWHTRLVGTVTVPVAAGTYTADQLATLLNANGAFAARAIAYVQGGFLGLRSRNLGKVHALQLAAGDVTTAVFAGDVTVKVPGGSTPSNTVASAATTVGAIPAATDDPKVTLYADRIEYQLDPVTDLEPGTYVVNLEFAQLGRVSATNYRTPSIAKVTFQVGQAATEKLVANNCNTCHESSSGKGLVLDPSRHNKILDDSATDQCGACHDKQPQDPNCPAGTASCGATTVSAWTGARPISKRVHAIHLGSSLAYPLATVDYGNGDPVTGRNWDITSPANARECQMCHQDDTSSGTWETEASRLPCSGCHDGDAASAHMKLMTYDPTPTMPWSGDEEETCKTCH